MQHVDIENVFDWNCRPINGTKFHDLNQLAIEPLNALNLLGGIQKVGFLDFI